MLTGTAPVTKAAHMMVCEPSGLLANLSGTADIPSQAMLLEAFFYSMDRDYRMRTQKSKSSSNMKG